jgi:signal transduction histidine kinase
VPSKPAPLRWAIPIGLVLLYPYGTLLLGPGPATGRVAAAGEVSFTLISVAFAAGAAIWACDWRLSRDPASGGAAAAMAFLAVQHLPVATLGFGQDPGAVRLDASHVIVAVVAGRLLLRRGGRTLTAPVGPATLGVILGAVVLTIRLALLYAGVPPTIRTDEPWDLAVLGVIAVGFAYLALAIARCELPAWVRYRSEVALVLAFVAGVVASSTDSSTTPPAAVALCAVAASLALSVAAGRLHQTAAHQQERMAALLVRTARSEARAKHEREVAHEVKTTVAGIAAAADLLAGDDPRISPQKRARLTRMINAEVGRLVRLFSEDPLLQPAEELPLDDIIEPLVTAQGALGHAVNWDPAGHVAVGQPDQLSTVLDILLSNAARHAGRDGTTLVTRLVGDRVEIRVTDDGPGVNKYLANRLFKWGGRSRRSPGSGIGLQHAWRLMREQGGTLHLDRSAPTGTTFVATLPASSKPLGPVHHEPVLDPETPTPGASP